MRCIVFKMEMREPVVNKYNETENLFLKFSIPSLVSSVNCFNVFSIALYVIFRLLLRFYLKFK